MSSSNVWRYRSAFIFAVVIVIALLSVPVAHAQQCGPMDVTFVVDETGSMTGVINQIQTQVTKIADAVVAASNSDYQFGLVGMPDNNVVVLLNMLPGNRADLDTAVHTMATSGGCGGVPYDEAFNAVVNGLGPRTGTEGAQIGTFNANWRPGAAHIVIAVTDTLPQAFTCSFQTGVHDVAAHNFAVQAAAKDIHLTMIYVPTGNTPEATIKAIMQDVATTSGGLFKSAKADASDLSAVILDIIAACGGAQGLGNSNTALVVDPTELFMGVGESADVSVTNFLPAGQGEVTTFTSDGLPADSTVTFLTRTPDVEGTEARTMHITIGPDTPGGTYIVTVKASRDGMKDQFNYVLVFVDCVPPFILGKNQLGAKNVSPGSTTKLSVIPGGNGPFKYQWYRGHSGSIASPIAGATKSEFTTPAINSPSEFWVRVKNACGSRDSATAVVKPNP